MKSWLRDAIWIAAATGISRVLGLVREVVVADQFGASSAYDAYLIAFFIPHMLRRLLAEGALSNAFIPLYAERLKNGRGEADQFASMVLSAALIIFPVLIGLGILFAPIYVPLLADGFDEAQRGLAIHLSQITFPFIGLMGLAAIVMGVLNSHGKFGLPALMPAFFNVAIIISVLIWNGLGIEALALGVLLGGLTQLLLQLPLLRGRFRFRWSFNWHDSGLRQLGQLLLPSIIGLAVVQINVLVDNKLASHLPDGGISALQYAIRLFQLPMGLVAVAISTAILPRLSVPDAGGMLAPLRQGIKLCALILLPATVGLFVLGKPSIELLFEHGAFTADATLRTANALQFYVLGLLPYGLATVLTRTFYALKDSKTPVWLSAVAVGVNVVLSILFVDAMGVGGLALATSIAGWTQLALTWWALDRKLNASLSEGILSDLIRALLASLIMGVVVWGIFSWTTSWTANEFLIVALPISVGIIAYVGMVWSSLKTLRREAGSTVD
jgi:putative peptidoglycan lipid II flippase